MEDWAPQTDLIIDRGYGGSRNGQEITVAIIHHVAGTDGRDYVAGANDRNSHPTYHVAVDGTVTGIVHPSRRPFSTVNNIEAGVDQRAITFEVDNLSVGGDWLVSQASINAVTDIIRYHASVSSRKYPVVLNVPGVRQAGFAVGYHQQYANTACPGPHVINNFGSIINQINGKIEAKDEDEMRFIYHPNKGYALLTLAGVVVRYKETKQNNAIVAAILGVKATPLGELPQGVVRLPEDWLWETEVREATIRLEAMRLALQSKEPLI